MSNVIDMEPNLERAFSPQASIHPSAKIGKNVQIGPWTTIGENVEIGDDCWIGPHVVIAGPTKIGRNNKIYQFSSIGDAPQDKTYQGEDTRLEIGDNNVIREYCMINRGTVKGGGLTKIGNDSYFMAYAHIGHDCKVGDDATFANYAALAGHVEIGDHVGIGAYSAVHQFCKVGSYAFVTKGSYVTKDVTPYVLVAGPAVAVCGLNSVGLRRHGFSTETMEVLRRAYKIIYRNGLTVQQACVELLELVPDCPEVRPFIDALQSSERGILR